MTFPAQRLCRVLFGTAELGTAVFCAGMLALMPPAFADADAQPRNKPSFKIDFDPPARFLGPARFAAGASDKLEFHKGYGADQSTLVIFQIERVGTLNANLEAQRCLAERFPTEIAGKTAKPVEIKNGAVVGAGVNVLMSNMNARADVLYACIVRPFGAVIAIFAEPKLRGKPSEMRNVIRALGQIKFTDLAAQLPEREPEPASHVSTGVPH